MIDERNAQGLRARQSFIEMRARERARAVLDPGSFRELLGPFERIKSPWLPLQGIVAQADDGVVLGRGTVSGRHALVAAIESAYQGGSMGEVSGAKIAAALALAVRDCERGRPILAVLLLETGGVRLQEANLGLAAIAEIHAGIVALRQYVPVIGVVAGMVGCFGGMSLAAALCSVLIVTRQARIGMNGPEVIEQEAGISELDASDRARIWTLMGGEQRCVTGLADTLVNDDAVAIAQAVREAVLLPAKGAERSRQVERYIARLAAIDAPAMGRSPRVSAEPLLPSRACTWFRALTRDAGAIDTGLASVRVADGTLEDRPACFIAVVPDPHNRFPRARSGEVGLDEAWMLASQVRRVITADRDGNRRPIIAVVDVASQAYGRCEEMLGIHLACAAAADAYASARLAGHPVIALLVGKAMSGAFLAHGYQANRILALDSPDVLVHAMSKQSAARVTRRSVAQLEQLGRRIVPMAYDVHSFARLGLLHKIIAGIDADKPSSDDIESVRAELISAIADARAGASDLSNRLTSPEALQTRAASVEVRRRLAEQWDGA